ncbi:Crp/Fnr family transcriptional regulator [bacterium]|nr:Crp/Fnr family transcriptional regulator [bacterium]RQV94371.1 MAG: Crp/Fnr family transcriptional regulator [bacterium]
MHINPISIIEQADYFKNLSAQNKRRLADICLLKNLNKKEILFLEGDKGHALYLCAFGSIQLHKTSPEGQEVVIKVVRAGEIFGEVILFEKERYPVTAITLEKSAVFILPKAQFLCLLEDSYFKKDFIANLMAKMRYLAEQVQYLTSYDVEARLFRFLKEQAGNKEAMKIDLSKKDVASAIGTTPETLSRLLSRLKDEKKLIWEGNRIQFNPKI